MGEQVVERTGSLRANEPIGAAGRLLFIASAGIALSGALDGRLPRFLFDTNGTHGEWEPAACWLIMGVAVAGLCRRFRRVSAWALAIMWLAVFVATSWSAVLGDFAATALVVPAESFVLALALGAGHAPSARARMLTVLLNHGAAAMLLLFGVIHIFDAAGVASLMPGWMPAREVLPFVTGAILMLGAGGLFLTQARVIAASSVAAMFVAWLPIVHATRIVSNPSSAFEWQFALMALALAAALFMIAGIAIADEDRSHRAGSNGA